MKKFHTKSFITTSLDKLTGIDISLGALVVFVHRKEYMGKAKVVQIVNGNIVFELDELALENYEFFKEILFDYMRLDCESEILYDEY